MHQHSLPELPIGGRNSALGDGPWMNLYDPLDPVCGGFDRKTAGGYRRGARSA
jgi:hypothetical protein